MGPESVTGMNSLSLSCPTLDSLFRIFCIPLDLGLLILFVLSALCLFPASFHKGFEAALKNTFKIIGQQNNFFKSLGPEVYG